MIFGSAFANNSTFSGYGGGVGVGSIIDASLEITDSSFLDNEAQLGGGGLAVGSTSGTSGDGLRINNSTFAGNTIRSGTAGGSSIAIQQVGAPFLMSQTTIDDADNGSAEGALLLQDLAYDDSVPAVGIGSSTIVGPGGVRVVDHEAGQITVTHSILDSVSPTLLALQIVNPGQGLQVDLVWNLLSTGSQPYYNSIAGNTFNVADMELGALADNGGPTQTRMPLSGSPAVNGGDPTVTAPGFFDQREAGFPRVVGTIDIGAVELQTLALAATGVTVNWWLLGGGAGLVLLGVGAILWVRLRRSGAHRA